MESAGHVEVKNLRREEEDVTEDPQRNQRREEVEDHVEVRNQRREEEDEDDDDLLKREEVEESDDLQKREEEVNIDHIMVVNIEVVKAVEENTNNKLIL